MNVCFLINSYERHRLHNYLLFANAALELGMAPHLATSDSMHVRGGAVLANCVSVTATLEPGAEVNPSLFGPVDLATFSRLWVIGFGCYQTKDIKLQMLWMLSQKTHVVNSVETLQFLHNKFHLNLWSGVLRTPETHVSNDFDHLWRLFSASDSDWVCKPPDGSFGRDVFLLRQGDTNATVLLQHLTGNGAGTYCLMQKYLPEIRNGEKRVLLARGEVVGVYRKDIVLESDHRTNVRQGGRVSTCELTAGEIDDCARIGRFFVDKGAYYVGVDLVNSFVLELNVVNPGGLASYERLTGVDLSTAIVSRVLRT